MATDPYASCPCGSGKKFKWCCAAIHADIDRAHQLDQEGQHEAALRLIEQITNAHADNPETWGQRAMMLYRNGKADEAEAMLQKAFSINPTYPFGYFLQSQFRLNEGELAGALSLLRKAAELYDPAAHDLLSEIYYLIFDLEMKLNRPIAARAAAQILMRHDPTNPQIREGIDKVFTEENPNFPALATKQYSFKPVAEERRARWAKAIAGWKAESGKLADVAHVLEGMVKADEADAASWFNLGLTNAWMGMNPNAVEAFNRYVAVESDETAASQAWALCEVLRCGQGMEDSGDYVEHSVVAPLRDPQRFLNVLMGLEKERLIGNIRVDQEQGILTGVMIEPPPLALTPELQARQAPRLGAYMVLMGNMLRLWNVHKESLDKAFETLKEKAGFAAAEVYPSRGPAKFPDVLSEAIIFPQGSVSPEEQEARLREHLSSWFEEKWIHKPLKSLDGAPALDAVGHPVLKRKVAGVVLFLEQCAKIAGFPYDFERLRRKLQLSAGQTTPAASKSSAIDFATASAAELASVALDALDETQLEKGFQAAMKLDARDIAGKYAHALVGRPPRADHSDRYLWHNHLVNLALGQGDAAAALDRINEGESDDCSNNGGQRRNDYELRRAQVLVKKGDIDEAAEAFDKLIARASDDLKIRGAATEAMLSARRGDLAKKFVEAGLAEARKRNDRDSEGYFLELQEAANRQR